MPIPADANVGTFGSAALVTLRSDWTAGGETYAQGSLLSVDLEALVAGDIDMGFNLPSSSASELNWVEGVTAKSFAVGYQYMMFFNTKRAALADVNVRKALALAVDRYALQEAEDARRREAAERMEARRRARCSPKPPRTRAVDRLCARDGLRFTSAPRTPPRSRRA